MNRPVGIKSSEITPEAVFWNRRRFMQGTVLAGTSLATAGIYRAFRASPEVGGQTALIRTVPESGQDWKPLPAEERPNMLSEISGYNNYYEFSTDKSRVARAARGFVTSPWT